MDPYGNTATLTSDSIGRNLVTTTTSGNTIQYNVPKEGGGTNTFTVTTEPISVNTSFNQSDVSEFSNGSLTAIQSVTLPDGSSYSFAYDSDGYGEMASMTLPTGGIVSLSYINYEDSFNDFNRWISSETENDGTTNFSPSVYPADTNGNPREQMKLTRPSGDYRLYTLTLNDGAWDGETDTYQGTSKIMTVVNNYNFKAYPCTESWICTGGEYITASSSTVTLNDSGQTAQTLYSYDAPWSGKVNSIQEFDYGVTGTPSRETDYTYQGGGTGGFLVSTKKELFNGALYSETAYTTYDGLQPTTEVNGLSGQATTHYSYDSNGMKVSMTDPNGNVTTYAYGCSDLYLSQTTYPQTSGISHITKANPDCNSGDPLSTTDENNQVTAYSYDALGRKSSTTYPDGGVTSYTYPSSSEVDQSRLLSGSTYSTVTTNWDGYGRKSQVSQSDPAGDDVVTYSYDGDNRLQCTTNPQRTGSAPTNGSTCAYYDALDRPTQIAQPDGNKIQVAYSGNQATVTDENGHQKRYQYDAFHDLTAIWEPNASGAPSWETTYSYDGAGHVTGITQSGDGSSAARQRTFQYDSLGRLISESTPERGAKSYGYDANGNLTSSTNAPGTIAYQYDALNRLTTETATGLTKNYFYDAISGVTLQNAIGRLAREGNGVNANEVYSYDAMGRVNWEASQIPSVANDTSIITRATYDLAGDLTSLTYPDGRVISESYDSAQHLTGIQYASWNGQSVNTSYYSATGFAPPGETTNATLGNVVQMAAGFNSRQSISALSYATTAQTLWSKQYTWAANAKNLLQIADVVTPAQTYNYTYDPDNRLATASGGGQTLVSPATSSTGSFTFAGGPDAKTSYQTCFMVGRIRECTTTWVYNYGAIGIQIGTSGYSLSYNMNTTAASLATALVSAISADPSALVTASASGATVYLTSKATGTISNYPLTTGAGSYWSKYFTGPSFSASASGADMTGGVNAVYSGTDVLNETYTVDPWGNQQESGNFNFQQSYNPANNHINGYGYDAAGDLTSDGLGNNYTYNAEGMLTATNSAQYVYDALQQRVEKTGGSNPTEVIYYNGHPIALLNSSSGTWTDLIWAGSNMLAEVAGTQAAVPVYRLLDHEGTLVATTDGSGNVTGTNLMIPYGDTLSSNTNDPYVFTGLYQDKEYGGDDAWYRNYSTEQSRWLTPDPYNGSYDLNNPQSFNRYMYVNGNPLGYVDPSGLAGAGVLTGIGGNLCLGGGPGQPGDKFNFCDPLISAISVGLFHTSAYVPFFSFAVTLGCSFAPSSDTTSSLCGQSGWTSAVFTGKDKWVGTLINDSVAYVGLVDALAIPGAVAAAGAPTTFAYLTSCVTGPFDPVCDVAIALVAYTTFNELFSVFWNLFGPPQFTGSLLPRPSDLGGLGTAPIGIPNQNLSITGILDQPTHSSVPSPGMNIQ